MRYYYSCIIGLLLIIFCSCEKKELPVKPHDPGNTTTATVNMGSPYKWQVYFSLRTNSIVGQNDKTAWDIGCEPTTGGYHIVLNSSKSMFAFNTRNTNFSAVTAADSNGFAAGKIWDAPSGNLDSTAIGDWRTTMPVYFIDRGYDVSGSWLGVEKFQVLSVTDTDYKVRFAALNGSGDTTIQVKKDSTYNLSFVSFNSQAQVSIEPPKATWDLEFTQYTYIFYDYTPPLPYLVTGCLLNRYNTLAMKDTADQFAQISYANISNYKLSNDISTIGYDWKTFGGTSYTINTNYNYIIETQDGRYFKMYFTGYYNSSGAEGNPQWNYQQM